MDALSQRPPKARAVLNWYDQHRRNLPWRGAPGRSVDPYRVWLSEIMLQQTTVVAVIPYFEAFLKRWSSVEKLAAADLDDVLHAWAGLGYYSRARNLHKCAKIVLAEWGGVFPDRESALLSLPGVGPYTAAAIAAIAFDKPATVVDGNVERVMARLFAIETELPQAKKEIALRAKGLSPNNRPGDYAQAVMDLGATICTPRNPDCPSCPWKRNCVGLARGIAAQLPRRAPKPAKPIRRGTVFWAKRKDGAILLARRPERGLLGGMWEFPSTPWEEGDEPAVVSTAKPLHSLLQHAPIIADWRLLEGVVRHTFTHFHLELRICVAETGLRPRPLRGEFVAQEKISARALPTIMKKVARHVGEKQ